MTSKSQQRKRRERQLELLASFEGDYYQEKQVGEEWHVKQWNGGTGKWQVAVFSKTSFRAYKAYRENHAPKIDEMPAIQAQENFSKELKEKLKSLGL